jgi:superfamily II DNA or RNA helicase
MIKFLVKIDDENSKTHFFGLSFPQQHNFKRMSSYFRSVVLPDVLTRGRTKTTFSPKNGSVFDDTFYDTVYRWKRELVEWIAPHHTPWFDSLWEHWMRSRPPNPHDPGQAFFHINERKLSDDERSTLSEWRRYSIVSRVGGGEYTWCFNDSINKLSKIYTVIMQTNPTKIQLKCLSCQRTDIHIWEPNCCDYPNQYLGDDPATDGFSYLRKIQKHVAAHWSLYVKKVDESRPLCYFIPSLAKFRVDFGDNIFDLDPSSSATNHILYHNKVLFNDKVEWRRYQQQAIDTLKGRNVKGILVLPCGAGKTLIGVHKIVQDLNYFRCLPALVVCNSNDMCMTWKSELMRHTSLTSNQVHVIGTSKLEPYKIPLTRVYIVTYHRLSTLFGSNYTQQLQNFISNSNWSCQILDECHVAQADIFRRVVTMLNGEVKNQIGLTATLSQAALQNIPSPLGDTILFHITQQDVRAENPNYLSLTHSYFIVLPIRFPSKWNINLRNPAFRHISRLNSCLGMNPVLYYVTSLLIEKHITSGGTRSKILVVCDFLKPIELFHRWYNQTFNSSHPLICGDTPTEIRQQHYRRFNRPNQSAILFVTTVADVAINLPCANVMIEMRNRYNSSTQSIQRVGRIARPKEGDNHSYHYILVNNNRRELKFANNHFDVLNAQNQGNVQWRQWSCAPSKATLQAKFSSIWSRWEQVVYNMASSQRMKSKRKNTPYSYPTAKRRKSSKSNRPTKPKK